MITSHTHTRVHSQKCATHGRGEITENRYQHVTHTYANAHSREKKSIIRENYSSSDDETYLKPTNGSRHIEKINKNPNQIEWIHLRTRKHDKQSMKKSHRNGTASERNENTERIARTCIRQQQRPLHSPTWSTSLARYTHGICVSALHPTMETSKAIGMIDESVLVGTIFANCRPLNLHCVNRRHTLTL